VTEWSVHVETTATNDYPADDEEIYDRLPELMEVMADFAAIPAGDSSGWSVTLAVEDDFGPYAASNAGTLVTEYAAKVGLPAWPITAIEVTRADLVDAEQTVPNFPDLVGSQEVAEMLSVSRQRLHELRTSGRFPEPMVNLAATPVWLRQAISTFIQSWDRRPGRRWPQNLAYFERAGNGWMVTVPGQPGSYHHPSPQPPTVDDLDRQWIAQRVRDLGQLSLVPRGPADEV
jgi:hypothetical protein